MLLSYSQGIFVYPKKPRFLSKPDPTLKTLMIHDDYALYIWFDGKWIAKIDLWHISVGIGMKHLPVWELYNFERFSSVWVNRVFSLIFFRNKIWINLNLIWFYEFHLFHYIFHCCIMKNVVLITLEVNSIYKACS